MVTTYFSNFSICVKLQLCLESFPRKRGQFHQVFVQKDDPLNDLTDIFEDSPSQHNFSNLHKLEAKALLLQLVVGLGGLFVHQ